MVRTCTGRRRPVKKPAGEVEKAEAELGSLKNPLTMTMISGSEGPPEHEGEEVPVPVPGSASAAAAHNRDHFCRDFHWSGQPCVMNSSPAPNMTVVSSRRAALQINVGDKETQEQIQEQNSKGRQESIEQGQTEQSMESDIDDHHGQEQQENQCRELALAASEISSSAFRFCGDTELVDLRHHMHPRLQSSTLKVKDGTRNIIYDELERNDLLSMALMYDGIPILPPAHHGHEGQPHGKVDTQLKMLYRQQTKELEADKILKTSPDSTGPGAYPTARPLNVSHLLDCIEENVLKQLELVSRLEEDIILETPDDPQYAYVNGWAPSESDIDRDIAAAVTLPINLHNVHAVDGNVNQEMMQDTGAINSIQDTEVAVEGEKRTNLPQATGNVSGQILSAGIGSSTPFVVAVKEVFENGFVVEANVDGKTFRGVLRSDGDSSRSTPSESQAATPICVNCEQAISPLKEQVISPPKEQAISPPKEQAASPPKAQAISPPKAQAISPPKAQAISPHNAQAISPRAPKEQATSQPKEKAISALKEQVTSPSRCFRKPRSSRKGWKTARRKTEGNSRNQQQRTRAASSIEEVAAETKPQGDDVQGTINVKLEEDDRPLAAASSQVHTIRKNAA